MTKTIYTSDFEEEEQKQPRKMTDFSYLLQRKCLRMMRRYFKRQFEQCGLFENYKKQVRSLTLEQFDEAIRKFTRIEFKYLAHFGEYTNFIRLEQSLKVLVLCDRYNKREPIIEGLDFKVVRDVLNKFNTRNLLNFFSENSNSFLFVHYFENCAEADARSQEDSEFSKLMGEMRALYEEADKYVKLQLEEFQEWRRHSILNPCLDLENEECCLFSDMEY